MINNVINYGSPCELINISLFRKYLLIVITLSSSPCEKKQNGNDNDDNYDDGAS
jgi:hypothetical protein